MEDGELEFSNQEMLSGSNFCEFPDSNSYMDSFLNEILKDTHACTHAHTCNPPGPDNSHTHTCYHVHTKIVPAPSEDKAPSDDTAESVDKKEKKRPLGNREAVRKYREKKKARAALLEDEVVRLRALNQQLLKRLQGQAVLEAEVARLKCLLVDIRGRIEGEIGSFPYEKQQVKNRDAYQDLVNPPALPGGGGGGAYVMNPCNMQCNDPLYCLQPGSEGGGVSSEGTTLNNQGLFNNCDFESLQCLGNQTSSGFKELPGCGVGNSKPANVSGGSKKKRAARAATAS
ncbi:basic leucine zipper 19-like isoform X1 [Ipomoea triloba]|uniref:basic leucine zipper 19-like isoform X1 n=1 Tax=Ipomoea triloba TaxID=35885 RepID=UPI00125D64A9|nr:basic leucine zipper 19-like isoform X1 [Ipomoea triloba]